MSFCNHSWKFDTTQQAVFGSSNTSYICSLCGAIMRDEDAVENVLSKLRNMRDGEKSSIERIVLPEMYGEEELAHICILVASKAKKEGLLLKTDDSNIALLQSDDIFTKHSQKNIVIHNVFKKSKGGYKNGDTILETIEICSLDKMQIKYTTVFCCGKKKALTWKSLSESKTCDIPGSLSAELSDWCERVREVGEEYDMTDKMVVAKEHYACAIITINGISYLLSADGNELKEIENIINVDQVKTSVEERKEKMVGPVQRKDKNKSEEQKKRSFSLFTGVLERKRK